MASISNLKNGTKQIDYKPPHYPKQTMRLGRASDDQAREFKKRIDLLIAAKKLGEVPDFVTLQWAKRIDRKFYKQLARVGLVRQREAYTVGELVKLVVDRKRSSVADSTLGKIAEDGESLISKVGAAMAIDDFKVQDANDFRMWLLTKGGRYAKGLAEATVSRRCRRCGEIFQVAVDERWIETNPFAAMGNWDETNEQRDRYITVEILNRLIAFSHRPQLNLMLALSRFGGLRGVAEFQSLEWEWMNWADNTLKVYAPKNRRHEHKRWRTIPVAPALREHLEKCWDIGALKVFNEPLEHQQISSQLETVCRRAGVAFWPKPFTNLRASCERDWLDAGHPIDAVTVWMGHSPSVALKHYNRYVKEQVARKAAGLLQPDAGPIPMQKNPQPRIAAPRGFTSLRADAGFTKPVDF